MLSLLNNVSNRHNFEPDRSIPNLSGKVIIVTGGNNGIGKESVLQLAKHHPAKLYLAARSISKYQAALTDIVKAVPNAKVDFLELDLASFASIKAAAETVTASNDRLDILMNNAGVMALPPGLTKEGFEIQFGTNHVGHALLTKLLMPLLVKTANTPGSDVRIVNLTSAGEMLAPKGGFLPEKCVTEMTEYHTYTRYGHSKLANILFTKELARRYPNMKSTAIHPGRVRTNLLTDYLKKTSAASMFQSCYDCLFMIPTEKGAWNQLWAATGKRDLVKSGAFYSPVGKEGGESAPAKDETLAGKLWAWQEEQFKRLGY